MRITFCGVRGSTPAPGAAYVRYGGNTSCVAVAHDGDPSPVLLLDAGTGLANATGLLGGAAFAGTILLSHLHWDHCLGLPFFRGGDRDDARVRLLLPDQGGPDQGSTDQGGTASDGRAGRAAAGQVMSPPFFPITPGQLRGDWEFGTVSPGQLKAEGFTVKARRDPAQGRQDPRLPGQRRGRALAYVTDHCPTASGRDRTGSAPTTRPRSTSPATRTCSFTTLS